MYDPGLVLKSLVFSFSTNIVVQNTRGHTAPANSAPHAVAAFICRRRGSFRRLSAATRLASILSRCSLVSERQNGFVGWRDDARFQREVPRVRRAPARPLEALGLETRNDFRLLEIR